ncbi:MAG: PP2C family protein-serine/threonine phosphatase [Acidobacteriota bacterium]
MRGPQLDLSGLPAQAPRTRFGRALRGCVLTNIAVSVVVLLLSPSWVTRAGAVFGIVLVLPVIGFWGIQWFRRKVLWKVRRRLFVSFLLIGVLPLFLSLSLSLVAEVFYAFFASASAVKLALQEVGPTVALIADNASTMATHLAAHGREGAGDEPGELLPQGIQRRFPGIAIHRIGPGADRDPTDSKKAMPEWMRGPAVDALFLEPGYHVAWASLRVVEGTEDRVLIVLPLDEKLVEELRGRLGIGTLVKVLALDEGWDDEDSHDPGITIDTGGHRAHINGDDDTEEFFKQVKTRLNEIGRPLPYLWGVTMATQRWEDRKPADVLVFFASSFGGDLDRMKGAYSGAPGEFVKALGIVFVACFVLAYMIFLGMGVLIAGAVSGGIGRLYQATTEFARGNLDFRIKVRQRDQLGHLAASMNAMADNVQRLLRESAERERLTQEFALAQEVQKKLLPPALPPFCGATVAGRLKPMSEVGGDTYDWMTLSDHELFVMIGDVSGHGLRPGLLAAMAKACLMTKVTHDTGHPAILQALHKVALGAMDRRLFMTVSLATFDFTAHTVTLSSAGHPPTLRYRDGAVAELGDATYPLGVREQREFTSRVHDLAAGDVYLLISDGVVEGRNGNGDVWGYDRLCDSLARHASRPAEEILDGILDDLHSYCGNRPQDDDITLVVVQIASAPAPAGEAPTT